MFANPVAPFMEVFPTRPFSAGSFHSRVRRAPEVLGEVPAACLAEEIDTPGPGQLKGLITLGCTRWSAPLTPTGSILRYRYSRA